MDRHEHRQNSAKRFSYVASSITIFNDNCIPIHRSVPPRSGATTHKQLAVDGHHLMPV